MKTNEGFVYQSELHTQFAALSAFSLFDFRIYNVHI